MKTLALCLLTLALTACTTDSSGPAADASTDTTSVDAADTGIVACDNDPDCPRGTTCEGSNICEVRRCEVKTDCGIGRICIAETGQCSATECAYEDECKLGQSCDQGLCVDGCEGCCTSRIDCVGTEQICNLLTLKCANPDRYCSKDEDCVYPLPCNMTKRVCTAAP